MKSGEEVQFKLLYGGEDLFGSALWYYHAEIAKVGWLAVGVAVVPAFLSVIIVPYYVRKLS